MTLNNVVLSGNLKFIALGDLFQLLGSNSSTGILRITSRYSPQTAAIYFEKGNPIDASYGDLSGLEALYPLFGWLDGEFTFFRENHSNPVLITKSRMSIILEALKMLDDGQIKKIRPGYDTAKPRFPGDPDWIPVITGPLVDYMYVADEESFTDGANIVEQGKHGGWVWVVLEGVVQIIKNTPRGVLPLGRLGEGSFIGSLSSFLIQGHVRTATAIAIGDVQLGVLDSQRLAQEFARMPPDFRALLISVDKRFKLVTERMVDLRLNPDPVQSDIEFEKNLAESKEVIPQGHTRDELYIIDEGAAYVVNHGARGPLRLARLTSGDCFGRIPFIDMDHEPDNASVAAGRHCSFHRIDASRFSNEYRALSPTFRNFVDNVGACISVTTAVVKNLFEQPPADNLL